MTSATVTGIVMSAYSIPSSYPLVGFPHGLPGSFYGPLGILEAVR